MAYKGPGPLYSSALPHDGHTPFRAFEPSKGGKGWSLDWEGDEVFIRLLGATKIGIDAVQDLMVADARDNHPEFPPESLPYERFATHEPDQQTIHATDVLDHARIEPTGWYLPGNPPHVWARWGVRELPRFHDDTGELQRESTKDIAMFLEFGTHNEDGSNRMEPRPFLYPAWDRYKRLLPALIKSAYEGTGGGFGERASVFAPGG